LAKEGDLMASENISSISDDQFDSEVLQSDKPVIVDFWAEWCGPCKSLAPTLEEIAEEYKDNLKIVKVNVDENQNSPQKYSVRGIPTLIFFKDGEMVETLVGNQPKDTLKEKVDSLFKLPQ
jgi:thioredoxin 1